MHVFKCSHCFKKIDASEELNNPEWNTTEEEFECPYCDKNFIVEIDPSNIEIETFILG